MAAGRSGIFSACSAVFFLFVCWAIQLQYSASGEARLDMDQFGSSLGLINLSNLVPLPEVVNSGDDGNLLFGNVIPVIGRFGLISALGNYVEGEQTCCSSCKSENDDCLQNANAISHIGQPNVVSRFHKLGRANATESPKSQSQSHNLGQATVPAAHSNQLVEIILSIFLACMIALTIGLPLWLYFKRPDLWQNRGDIAYAILRRPGRLLIWGNEAAAAA